VAFESNGTTLPKIVPTEPTMTADQALAGLQAMLTPEQGSAWLKDSRLRVPWA
jgi:hypothetical protein